MRYKGLIRAPDFPKGLDWLNTNKPLSIKELRGGGNTTRIFYSS